MKPFSDASLHYCYGQGLSDLSTARFAGTPSPKERGGNRIGQHNSYGECDLICQRIPGRGTAMTRIYSLFNVISFIVVAFIPLTVHGQASHEHQHQHWNVDDITENWSMEELIDSANHPDGNAESYQETIVEIYKNGVLVETKHYRSSQTNDAAIVQDLKSQFYGEPSPSNVQPDNRVQNIPQPPVKKNTVLSADLPAMAFDPQFAPYYAGLNEAEKKIYRQFYDAIYHLKKEIYIDDYETAVQSYEKISDAIEFDQPELFWYTTVTRWIHSSSEFGNSVSFEFEYNDLAQNRESHQQLVDRAVNEIVSKARQYQTPLEKERFVHDYLANAIEYEENSEHHQNAYGALIYHKTVCAGFAKSFQLVMRKLGIPTCYVAGFKSDVTEHGLVNRGTHAWNTVMLNGKAYNVDVTYDNSQILTRKNKTKSYISYLYFNKTDAYFQSHGYELYPSDHAHPLRPWAINNDADLEHGFSSEEIVRILSDRYPISKDMVVYTKEDYNQNLLQQLMTMSGKSHKTYSLIMNAGTYQSVLHNTWDDRHSGYLDAVCSAKKVQSKSVTSENIELSDNVTLFIERYLFKGK